MSDDTAYLEVLASCTDAASEADLSDDGWSPPDGDYTVSFDSLSTGMGKKSPGAYAKASFTVIDGEFEGRIFTDFFWLPQGGRQKTASGTMPAMGIIGLGRLTTIIAGHEVKQPTECIPILDEAAAGNTILQVQVYRSKIKSGKRQGEFAVNVRYLNTIASTEEVGAAV